MCSGFFRWLSLIVQIMSRRKTFKTYAILPFEFYSCSFFSFQFSYLGMFWLFSILIFLQQTLKAPKYIFVFLNSSHLWLTLNLFIPLQTKPLNWFEITLDFAPFSRHHHKITRLDHLIALTHTHPHIVLFTLTKVFVNCTRLRYKRRKKKKWQQDHTFTHTCDIDDLC